MTNCHIFNNNVILCIEFVNKLKGYEMSLIIKNAESLFERFENSVEEWAEKLF